MEEKQTKSGFDDPTGSLTVSASPSSSPSSVPSPSSTSSGEPLLTSGSLPSIPTEYFTIEEELARGGQGQIHRARDTRLGRTVAIKQLIEPSLDGAARFTREALLTARLQHPSIVPVYEAGRWASGIPFFAMKLVEGQPLSRVVYRMKALEERLGLLPHVIAVAEAVAYAHHQGVIHRDLKPANVLVGAFGETVVIDWGLAKESSGDAYASPETRAPQAFADLTAPGAVLGTFAYMSPEQARGEELDALADVYALGAMLYYVLAGLPPYAGIPRTTPVSERKLIPLEERDARIPKELCAIVQRAMAYAKEDRYSSAKEMAADLQRFTTGKLVSAYRYSARGLAKRWLRRHALAVGAGGVGLLVALIVGAISILGIVRARDRADAARAQAEQAREQARAAQEDEMRRADEVTLLYARAALDSDPTQALAGLRKVSPSFRDWKSVRDIATEARLRGAGTVYRGHTGEIYGVAHSPDGRLLASASADKTIRIWDLQTGNSRVLSGHREQAIAVAFSPDGKQLASCSLDKTVRIWSVATGEGRVLGAHDDMVISLAFSPDGVHVASGSGDGTVRLWDVARGGYREMGRQKGAIYDLSFSADGNWLAAAAGDGTVRVSDMQGSGRSFAVDPKGAQSLAFLPDGQSVVAGTQSGKVLRLDIHSGEKTLITQHDGVRIGSVAISPDGRWVASTGKQGRVRVNDIALGEQRDFMAPGDGESLKFSPDGRWLAIASSDHDVRRIDVGSAERVLRVDDASALATLRDGRIAVGTRDGHIQLWDVARGEHRAWKTGSSPVRTIAISPDDAQLTAGAEDGVISLWRTEDGSSVTSLRGHLGTVYEVAYTRDGRGLVSAGNDGTARRWDVATRKNVWTWAGERPLYAIAVSPDGKKVATASWDKMVRLADISTGTFQSLEGHTDWVNSLSFSPDGILASGCNDQTVRLWDIASRTSRALTGAGDRIHDVTYSPDGARVMAVADGGGVHTWSPASAERLASRTLPGPARAIATIPGGAVVTLEQNGTMRIWSDSLPLDAASLQRWIAGVSP